MPFEPNFTITLKITSTLMKIEGLKEAIKNLSIMPSVLKTLREHSLGQRASALVLIILTQDDSDIIIIDQPEDDLDNKVVYREFIKTVKAKKLSVQFIFATHNPNIPVLGDAERVIATAFTEQAITPTVGNIDNAESHTLIVDIMEGGQEAFQRRNDIYQAWHKRP